MPSKTSLAVIDGYSDVSVFEPLDGAPPPLVTVLQRMDARQGPAVLAPAILCDGDRAARARGALLVSGDQDGVAIVLPSGLAAGDLALIAAAYGWQIDPACRVSFITGRGAAGHVDDVSPRPVTDRHRFHPSKLKGCLVPSEWLLLAIRTGDQL